MLATLLAEMDGVGHIGQGRVGGQVFVIATSTVEDGRGLALDTALLRPGRLELSIAVPLPSRADVVEALPALVQQWQGGGGDRPQVKVEEGLWEWVGQAAQCPPWNMATLQQLVQESIVQAGAAHDSAGHWAGVALRVGRDHVRSAAQEIGMSCEGE
jgi:hypothetical protein